MTTRRKQLAAKFGNSKAKTFRRNMVRKLSQMDVDKPTRNVRTSEPMDVDQDLVQGSDDPMEIHAIGPICAARTKPVAKAKFQKRVGAKTAKKLEIAENSAFELSPTDATMYRALAARCNYLS